MREGRRVDDVDILIAGIALEQAETVVTRNTGHFERIEDLRLRPY